MKLHPGTVAPPFVAEDIFGQVVDLSAYAGRPILLSFFRNGACALCNLRVHELIEKYPDYRAPGLEVIAVFESPRDSVRQHVGKQDAPFPIIADAEARLYALYGVESDEATVMDSIGNPKQDALVQEAEAIGYKLTHEEGSNFFRLPADFLIGPDGKIEQAFYSAMVGEHLPFAAIEQFLRQVAAHS